MAGAGYKLFNTGDVLTAAQVNTYLQEQTVMVFANSTARTTALSGVLAEGMMSYLSDQDLIQYYNGTSWVTVNTDQTPLTTKGDLFTFSTSDARLAVGNNGETLVADSSQSTGLRWGNNYGFTAGKNKIINGDFFINQRSFSSTTSTGYGFDRWFNSFGGGGTVTCSAQTFTAGAAPVAGYESRNFSRIVTTGQTATNVFTILLQKIEDVRTFANQTVTISFWAKANSGTPKIAIELEQDFGSGGSPSAAVTTAVSSPTISTSWARYSATVTVPSISGKTIGTTANSSYLSLNLWVSAGTDFNSRTSSLGIQTNTFDIWGVQVEAGSVATAFQTATGTLAGELAACMRYYQTSLPAGTTTHSITTSQVVNAQNVTFTSGIRFAVPMRVAPTVTVFSRNNNSGKISSIGTGADVTGTSQAANIGANQIWGIENTSNALTAGTGYDVSFNASAEL